MKLAMIGLGKMGGNMAERLRRGGHEVVGFDAFAADRSDVASLPGVATASELMGAVAQGFDTVKFFPAVPAGGIAALRALGGPFPTARFCPTGGIGEENAAEWLALPSVAAVGGSWLTPADDVRAGRWSAIQERARRAAALA